MLPATPQPRKRRWSTLAAALSPPPAPCADLSKNVRRDYLLAFNARLIASEIALIDSALLGLPEFAKGSVWLVGAGPGDPGLLTALGLHALARADAVVYDALVDPRILRLAQPEAALDYAGKRGGRPSPSQPDISARLIKLARDGNRVLRLKGGDPCVFGRDGEMSEELDWVAIARGAPVLVVYMASRHLRQIAGRLLACGRGSDEPIAIISKATTPEQSVTVSTLGGVARFAPPVQAPAIVVIGEVVRLHAALNWTSGLP